MIRLTKAFFNLFVGVLLFSGCDTENPEPKFSEEPLELTVYEEMIRTLPQNWEGTACFQRGSYRAFPGATVVYSGAFYGGDVRSESDEYEVKWTVSNGAKIIGSDSSRTVSILFEEGFDKVVVLAHNTESVVECSTSIEVYNAENVIQVGEPGEGGAVIYDKGQESDGWQFIESSEVINYWAEQSQWGCLADIVQNTSGDLGDGKMNTERLWANECNQESALWAYQLGLEHVANGYWDWYLPSLEEAKLIQPGDYAASQESFFIWTSTEVDNNNAYMVDLISGDVVAKNKDEEAYVVAVRYF
ncbi:DUF1566 domain-containing protein [Marinoscillum pacificum]|uniref:DUF1566 domain-containing protein n=1 Tax=Marinoscillum pacificum TaxID=392723 RepID=UPI002157991C|nr:DUF1566 domain-containing protein [Marinoscillum pacificum]